MNFSNYYNPFVPYPPFFDMRYYGHPPVSYAPVPQYAAEIPSE
jgi:hypothetical protein